MKSKDIAKERLITDIEPCDVEGCECSTEKDPLGDTLDAMENTIEDLKRELVLKDAAVKVLMAENANLRDDLGAEREHRERLSYMMAEAGK